MTQPEQKTRKPVICFVDDDPHELKRFEAAMQTDFICVTGEGYTDCVATLKQRNLRPDLWVLDLFFPVEGHVNTAEQLGEMNTKYARLEQQVQEFRTFLQSIKQGPSGGLTLLKQCREHQRVPVIMFTRKGTLDDAIRCRDEGAVAVLKKPMPATWPSTPEEQRKAMDEAMLSNRAYLRDKFQNAISANTFLAKHRFWIGAVVGILVGGVVGELISLLLTWLL